MRKRNMIWLTLTVVIIVVDQLSKFLISHNLLVSQEITLLPFLNFTLKYNTGAAYGFLNNLGGWQIYFLAGISIFISLVVLAWILVLKVKDTWLSLALSLILGGAIGNLIDRIRLNYVIDFIDFHIKNWHFATFNIADSAISIGAFLLILRWLFEKRK